MSNSPLNRKLLEGFSLEQFTGTATTSAAAISLAKEGVAFYLFNSSTTKNLKYSIDGGSTYMSILPLGEVDRPYISKTLHVKSNSGTAGYEIEVAERR